MKRMLLALLVLLIPVFAFAQSPTVIAVDITRAELAWDAPADGGSVVEYRIMCGTVSGAYTLPLVKTDATGIAITAVIPQPGRYYCVVAAANQFGAGQPSNEVAFEAGVAPGAAKNLIIRVK